MSDDATALRRRRRGPAGSSVVWIGGAAALVVIVVALVITLVIRDRSGSGENDGSASPAVAVRTFLGALANADSQAALKVITAPPSREYLGADPLQRQHRAAPISNVVVNERIASSSLASSAPSVPTTPFQPSGSLPSGSQPSGSQVPSPDDAAIVDAAFRIGDHHVHTSYRVVRDGGRWLVANGVTAVDIGATSIPGVSLLGRSVSGQATVYVFPGRLAWGSGSPYLGVRAHSAEDSGGAGESGSAREPGNAGVDVVGGRVPTPRVTLTAELTDAGTAAVDAAVQQYLDRCAGSTQADASTDRPGCVQRLYRSAKVSSVRWNPPDRLDDLVTEIDQADPTRVAVFGSVTWKAGYTATYGGDATDEVAQPMDGSVDLAATPSPVYAPGV